MWLKELRNREFSAHCEDIVCRVLKEQGWKVYRPKIDRYIDIVAIKKIRGKEILRTIQVKGSRVENIDADFESYGLTQEPKDLLHSPNHYFVWVMIDRQHETNYLIIPISEFINIRTKYLFESTRRKHASLLMRGEWRHGTDRMHPKRWLNQKSSKYLSRTKKMSNVNKVNSPSWELEGVVLDRFVNSWDILEETYNSCWKEAIDAQEIDSNWTSSAQDLVRRWKDNNAAAFAKLSSYPDALRGSKRLDETGYPE